MAIREEFAGKKPLAGVKIMGSLHMTVQTAVLIETLDVLGADVRWVSCNIFSTQDHAAAAVVVGRPETGGTVENPKGIPVFAWKGETLDEYWWCTKEALVWPDGSGPSRSSTTAATRRCSCTRRSSTAGRQGPGLRPEKEPEEWGIILQTLRDELGKASGAVAGDRARHQGRQRGDDHGRPPPVRDDGAGTLLFPAINVNDAVTKSKFDNLYGCRHSLTDGLMRASDVMLGGKVAVVFGYGDVGKGCAQSLRGQGAASSSPRSTPSARCRPRWKATR